MAPDFAVGVDRASGVLSGAVRMNTPDARIHHPVATEYFFVEGCFITEVWNSPHDVEVSVARARVEPGVTTRWHRLDGVTERYLILEGQGYVEVGNELPETVGPGAVVLIPPETRQRITHTGNIDLVFLAVCTPRFTQAVYEEGDPD